jgi:hypothetical protein
LNEPYVSSRLPGSEAEFGPVTVPKGRLWVMGDNRAQSDDSRYHYVNDYKNDPVHEHGPDGRCHRQGRDHRVAAVSVAHARNAEHVHLGRSDCHAGRGVRSGSRSGVVAAAAASQPVRAWSKRRAMHLGFRRYGFLARDLGLVPSMATTANPVKSDTRSSVVILDL